MSRVRSPIASRFGYLDKTRAQCQRRMPGEVRNCEHLVAQRGHQKKVYLREYARHLLCYVPSETIGLNQIDRRQETRFTKLIWPCIRDLHPELVHQPSQSFLLKRRGGF